MARNYTLNTFLRQTPNALLAAYFDRRNLLTHVHFLELRKTEVEPVMEGIEALDPDERADVEADFQQVFSLAAKAGTRTLIDQAALTGLFIADEIEAMENHYHRAMWLFLNHGGPRSLFADCVTIARFDDLSFTASRRRKDLPCEEPRSDETTLTEMAAAISALYKPQGRGYRCKVEYFRRMDPLRHCFYAYPEDYTTSELQYADGATLARRTRKSVFEVALVFRSDEGVLEISAPGRKRDIQTLQEVFCRLALGMDRLPPPANHRCYELNGLKRRSFQFPTEPADRIARVDVVGLRLDVNGRPRQRVLVENDPSSDVPFHDWMASVVDQQKVPLAMLDVGKAHLRVEWEPVDGKKAQSVSFWVGMPDTCSLKDDPHHLVVKRYLKAWQIAP